jgi:two-component system response regulator YesN
MYKVILVDDDVAVLEFLGKLISWDQLGFELTGSFTNAFEALEACVGSFPDLVITDIGMPGMDGIELIRTLQARAAKIRFVILSCHDEFKYAQYAVQLGVQDYILKETLNMDSMLGIIERVKQKMDEDFRLKLEFDKLNYQALRSKTARKESWLKGFLSNPLLEERSLIELFRDYGLDAELNQFIPVCCRIHSFRSAIFRYEKEENLKFITENAVEELLHQEPSIIFFSYTPKEFFLMGAFRKDLKSNSYDYFLQVSQKIQEAFAKYLKLDLSILIGKTVTGAGEMKRQIQELQSEAEYLYYSEAPEIQKWSGIPTRVEHEDLFMHYSEYSESLNRLLLGESGEIDAIVDSLIHFFKNHKYPPSDVKQFVWKLALDLQLKLRFSRQYHKERGQQQIAQTSNIGELRDWLLQFMKEAVMQAELISSKSKKLEVIDAQKYVLLNLNRKITLEEVSKLLHLNTSYFSRFYKKETGENFIEYVTRMKMEKAKELLGEPGKTVENVADMLGYDNKSYFVKLFKQHCGTAPSRYI